MAFAKVKQSVAKQNEIVQNGCKVKPKGGESPMIQIVLQNEDNIIIDSAKVKSSKEIIQVLTKWLADYQFLNRDKITFYRF